MSTPLSTDDNKGRFLSQGQLAMIRSALEDILINAEALQKSPQITQREKGQLEEIKKDTHGIARILKQARREDCGQFLGEVEGILKDLREVEEVLK